MDEAVHHGESALDYVRRVAQAKAVAVGGPGEIVVAADTTVEIEGEILTKPVDAADARRMLERLGGDTHRVHTAVVVRAADRELTTVVTTEVDVVPLTAPMIDWYVGTGEPMDKAGAYAIQGRAAGFVSAVRGSVTNVVGLPLAETLSLLDGVGALRRR